MQVEKLESMGGVKLTRRSVLTAATACGVLSSTQGCSSLIGQPAKALETFRASCTMECLHCYLKATVKDGKIVKIESDNPYPGKACGRGLSRVKWVYAKDRVLTPLKCVGKRGEGRFEAISWDEALDLLANKIREAIQKDGSESLLMTSASGNMDSLTNAVMKTFGQYLGGVTHQVGSLCCSAVTAAMIPMVGFRYVDTRDTIDKAKLIISWGSNPMVSMQAYWPKYLKMQEAGGRLIVIDPRRSETAARANQWVSITPGTDAALALGMIRVILEEKRYDEAFLKAHTGAVYLVGANGKLLRDNAGDPNSYLVWDEVTGAMRRHDAKGVKPALRRAGTGLPESVKTVFDLIVEAAEPWTLEATQAETGIDAKTIGQLARDYATSPASMIIANMGSFQRVENGTYAVAGLYYLSILTGQISRAGTGVCDAGGVTQMATFGAPVAKPKVAAKKVEGIPTAKLAEWVLADKPHKINLWYSMTCGLLGQWPNANLMVKALEKVPFLVVADSLMTPTARYADLVLPVTTIFEYETLLAGARTHYVQWSEKAVEPQGVAKPDRWIFAQLAKRLGFGEAFDLSAEEMARNVLKPSGITLEEVKAHPVCPVKGDWVPFAGGQFRTPTKKAHLFCESWAEKGFPPILTYIRAKESPKGDPKLGQNFPLQAIQHKVIRNIHTSHQHNEWLNEVFPDAPTVEMNAKDAQRRGLKDRDFALVYNERGEHKARVIITAIREGTVALENGWWFDTDGFTTSSVLTNDAIEVLGSATCIGSTLVEVKKA